MALLLRDNTRAVAAGICCPVGLVLRDMPEGLAMANAHAASPALGALVALAIALHNLPEEFAMPRFSPSWQGRCSMSPPTSGSQWPDASSISRCSAGARH